MSRTLDILIPKELLVWESYIEDKMAKRIFTIKGHITKKYWKLEHVDMYGPFSVRHEGMSTLSLLLMITVGLDICI